MDFRNALFTMPLMVGSIFVVVGFIMLKFPPKKINMLYGYRTALSMKNQEHWRFSQKYSAVLMIYGGFGLMLSSIVGLIFNVNERTGVFISMAMIICVVILFIYRTEQAIKKHFDE